MGTVYEADEIESGRRVALKVLARLTQPSERERFEREGRLAWSVNHPHCVFVFSASEIHGHLVIVMEVMQGTLADRLEGDGALATTAAVDAILQLLTGLQAAEAAGILHRDIKPSNCFVDAYGPYIIRAPCRSAMTGSRKPATGLSGRARPVTIRTGASIAINF